MFFYMLFYSTPSCFSCYFFFNLQIRFLHTTFRVNYQRIHRSKVGYPSISYTRVKACVTNCGHCFFFNFHYTSTTLHYPSYLSNGLSIFEFYQRHSIAGGSHYLCHLRVCSLLSIHPASSMATRLPGEEGIFTTKNGCWVTLDIKHGFSEL